MSQIDWPLELDRHAEGERRETTKFEVELSQAVDDLETEMDRLDVDDWRLETAMDHQSQNPNYPYANQPQPDDPGAVVSWTMDGEDYAVGCDRWTRVRDNVREICLYVGEKRKMEDRPVSTGQSEFATARLPSGDGDAVAAGPPAHVTLGVRPDADRDEIREAYRERVKEVHPDQNGGGDSEAFQRVKRARDALLNGGESA
ncbi:heat shock protein DnaJ domain protein [Halovivax asiaticus JCM 14624]|uniref:Heat shock protein DnaJ domain protein n=1 Tax=Halovivax asiaticus JCM 14624 TaxID=1227490 RepID=M0BCD7_9EURY|nr:J domain-containing protein [Halovivax asiaticus]ELZ08485.1 heat shock protein DnaJ domain protein [Halovivax asiaticus JCM 14624]